MQKSFCALSSRFELNEGEDILALRMLLAGYKKPLKPLNLTDKNRYYKHVWQNGGIMHVSSQDLFQWSLSDLSLDPPNESFKLTDKQFFLDDSKRIELVGDSLHFIVILDSHASYGILFILFELIHHDDNPLKTLAENKFFRYFKDPGDSETYKLKIYEKNQQFESKSLYAIFQKAMDKLDARITFPNPKPVQFHYFDKAVILTQVKKDSCCYNLLRIPAAANQEVEERYFERNPHHVYENTSIYAFAMSEGAVLMSPYKTPKQLFSNFFSAQLLALLQKERSTHLISIQATHLQYESMDPISSKQIESLRHFRKLVNLTNYYNSMPISQYSEIQEVYGHFKDNFLSGSDFDNIKVALNEITTLIQEESERKSNERGKNIGIMLGVLGITGFISFVFDYFFISKNQKLLDSLEFPFNLLPLFVFLTTFLIIWRAIYKK